MALVQNRQIQQIRTGDLVRLLGITRPTGAQGSEQDGPNAGSRPACAAASICCLRYSRLAVDGVRGGVGS